MTVQEVIRAKLLTMAAVTAITSTIRPDRLQQHDRLPAIMIEVPKKEYQNDLLGTGGLVNATVMISGISSNRTLADSIGEAIRINGTNPGTGLAGFTGTVEGLKINAILTMQETKEYAFDDGKDSGFFSCDSTYEVWYNETI